MSDQEERYVCKYGQCTTAAAAGGEAARWRGVLGAQASNILSVDTKPWSPEGHVYEPEVAEDPHTGAMRVQLNQRIRFRMVDGPDGRPVRESNARFVRWSDGSLQVWLPPLGTAPQCAPPGLFAADGVNEMCSTSSHQLVA